MSMDELRVTVSVFGRFHAFDLARQLHRAGVLSRLITTYPKYFAQRWGLPRERISSLLPLELVSRALAIMPLSDRLEHLVQSRLRRSFDHAASRRLPASSNVFVGWSGFSPDSMRAAKSRGMKTVVDRGGSHIRYQTQILEEEYARWGYHFRETPPEVREREIQEYAEADRVAVPSLFVQRTFIECGVPPEKLLHLPYGVSLEQFFPVPKEDDVFRVMHCGVLSLQKGLPYLLQAFHELDLPRSELWLVGPSKKEITPILNRYQSSKIILKGVQPQNRLHWFYSQCSVFCLASVDDGFGMVIPQAMACGLPVIHTTNTGGKDIIDDNVQGFEVPIRDVEALKEKIFYLYENADARREMGRQARGRAVEALSWDQYGDRAVAAYRNLLHPTPGLLLEDSPPAEVANEVRDRPPGIHSQETGAIGRQKIRPKKSIYYVQYFNPAALPPLEHSALIFKRSGDQVFLSGIAEVGGAGLITIVDELSENTRLWRMQRPGWRQKVHYLAFVLYHLWKIARGPRGWVYASDLFACPIVCLVKWLRLGRVVYHEHDSPTDSLTPKKGFERVLMCLRRRAAVLADLVVLPNRERASLFDERRPGRPPAQVVWNCPRQEEAGGVRPAWDGKILRLLYHGSIVPERMPFSVLEAMARFAGRITLSIVGYFPLGVAEYADALRAKVSELGLGSSVRIKEAMPRGSLMRFATGHDVGLAFMPQDTRDINMKHMLGASNKAFDYLAVGVALLVGDLPDWRALYVEPGYALACNPYAADSVAVALQQFLDDSGQIREMGERGRQRILSEWNYETQFAPVLREMVRFSSPVRAMRPFR